MRSPRRHRTDRHRDRGCTHRRRAYSFLIRNSGPSAASSVAFTDPVPAGVTQNYATSQGSILPCSAFGADGGGTYMRCDVGTIVKGGQATVVVSVNAPQVAQSITNTATVSSAIVDPNAANNSATVNVTVKAPSGGVCKGGTCDLVPPTTAAPCASLTSISAPVGYYSSWAAVWNAFTIQSCSTGDESISIEVTETNQATGIVGWNAVFPLSLTRGQNASVVLDNDFAPFNTSYAINYTVRDSAGLVLATASTSATTPPPQ